MRKGWLVVVRIVATGVGLMSGLLSIVREFLLFSYPARYQEAPLFWASAKVAFVFAAIAYCWIENKEKKAIQKERDELAKRFSDERPLLGIETHSVEGPTRWREDPVPVTFSLHHLSGRVPTAIYFEPILSLSGRFSLHFEAVPHVEKHPQGIRYRIDQIGAPRLNAHDLEKIGNIEGKVLQQFLDDSPPEMIDLNYSLIARFKDGGEERTQAFWLTFDKERFRFLANTAT